MRTAASTYHEIEYYVNLDVTVAGVTASIRCYCLLDQDTRISYTLLLGRRWMKQVWALGDYDKETYHIHDMAGYRYAVDATIAALDIQAEVPQICANTHSAPVQAWDEESVIELKLSWKDLCEKLHRRIYKQVIDAKTERETGTETDGETTESADERASAFDADEESGEEEEEDSDDNSGNPFRHKVPSIRVAVGTRVA